jgi:hypothetical protein
VVQAVQLNNRAAIRVTNDQAQKTGAGKMSPGVLKRSDEQAMANT